MRLGKYNNKRINTEDGWFDSQRELKRWEQLKLLECAGEIDRGSLKRQVKYELVPKQGAERSVSYRADFVYKVRGKEIVEDAKGFRDRVYKIKRRLMLWRYNIAILES